jgi:hypothetical protein
MRFSGERHSWNESIVLELAKITLVAVDGAFELEIDQL